MTGREIIRSRDNPLLARIRRLQADPGAGRRTGGAWVEGDHLLSAALAHGVVPEVLAVDAAAADVASVQPLLRVVRKVAYVESRLWRSLSQLESPALLGGIVPLPSAREVLTGIDTVVLDRLQDPGNVGSILRSASALGVRQVVALKGTVALWSPKVLRAGMGAHFGLHLLERASAQDLEALRLPWVGTSSHATVSLHEAELPQPCAWLLGHEGGGLSADLLARCALQVAIAHSGGEESLNVAAAAAICLHESQRRRMIPKAP